MSSVLGPRLGLGASGRLRRLILFSLALLLLGGFSSASVATAHGKELSIEVSSFTPDPEDPQVRFYRVLVTYAGDTDPVDGATVQFTMERQGGSPPIEPIILDALNEPGLYVTQVAYPMYGSWNVTLSIQDLGAGETSFVEEVLPPGPVRDNSSVRQQVLQLFFRFDWKDVVAIVVRVAHTLAGVVWFSLTGVILVGYWLVPPSARVQLFRNLSRFFLPAALFSLALIAASGVYSAIFSAPIKSPGVFDFDTMLRIPFGPHYMATIAFKMVGLSVSGVLALRMARALRFVAIPVPAGGSALATSDAARAGVREAATTAPLLRLALMNVGVGIFVVINVVLAIYLHYISHLAVFLPE